LARFTAEHAERAENLSFFSAVSAASAVNVFTNVAALPPSLKLRRTAVALAEAVSPAFAGLK